MWGMVAARKLLIWVKRKIFSWVFVKFGIVGGIGVIVNMATFWVMTALLGVNHLVASAAATEIAILNNFMLNDLWTFRERRGGVRLGIRLLYFHGSRILGLLVTVGSLYLLADLAGLDVLSSQLIGVILGTLTNFITSDLFVWPEARPSSAAQSEP